MNSWKGVLLLQLVRLPGGILFLFTDYGQCSYIREK